MKPRRWTKGDCLGSGSFGTVYLGLNGETGELFREIFVLDESTQLALAQHGGGSAAAGDDAPSKARRKSFVEASSGQPVSRAPKPR